MDARGASRRLALAVALAPALAVALAGCSVVLEDVDAGPAAAEQSTGPRATPSSFAPATTAPAGPSGAYVVLETDETTGQPVTYASCRPVRWVSNLDGAPEEVQGLVDEAVRSVAQATGLQFVDEGSTDERADPERDVVVDGYGDDRWAPVLIAWTDPDEVPDLEGDTAGVGGSIPVSDDAGRTAYVSGDVLLDGPDLEDMLAEPGGSDLVRAVVEHELAHLVGLDHVDDDTQLMYPEATGEVTAFQAGDLAGLAAMGSGPCVDDLATPGG